MKEISGKQVHIVINTINVIQLLNKTSERFESEPQLIPLIFGKNVEKEHSKLGEKI